MNRSQTHAGTVSDLLQDLILHYRRKRPYGFKLGKSGSVHAQTCSKLERLTWNDSIIKSFFSLENLLCGLYIWWPALKLGTPWWPSCLYFTIQIHSLGKQGFCKRLQTWHLIWLHLINLRKKKLGHLTDLDHVGCWIITQTKTFGIFSLFCRHNAVMCQQHWGKKSKNGSLRDRLKSSTSPAKGNSWSSLGRPPPLLKGNRLISMK